MADADRDSDLGDDSPVSGQNGTGTEGESSGDQSDQSSDEGVGRDGPAQLIQPLVHAHLQTHQPLLQPQSMSQTINHQQNNASDTTRPHETIKVRSDFESLRTSLHPHLSSLASLAQGAPLSSQASVFTVAGGGNQGSFSYAPSAFLAPAPPPPAQPAGSASSSSSEGSAAGWSFEEQYKQVRQEAEEMNANMAQLYELSPEPERKEFLDDLFSFMQRRGTPITRLPIMAKSVLDLYELYRHVLSRGGLVEVINKKMWQEIIKGLNLPSSITSAAFTLRTQYMKFLYEYECEKNNLSTHAELEAAIEGNKREGRRSTNNNPPPHYDSRTQAAFMQAQLNRSMPSSLAQLSQMTPFQLNVLGLPRLPHLAGLPPQPANPQELEYSIRECMRMMSHRQAQMDNKRHSSESPPRMPTPPSNVSPREVLQALDPNSRLALWPFYNNTLPQPELEPQREALNLSPKSNSTTASTNASTSGFFSGGNASASSNASIALPVALKREACSSPAPASKRRTPRSPSFDRSPSPRVHRAPRPRLRSPPAAVALTQLNGDHANGDHERVNGDAKAAAFEITTRGDAKTGEQKLEVTVNLNGVTYKGFLSPSAESGDDRRHHSQVVT